MKQVLSEIDIGGWAQHYATRPLGHYKPEIYRLFMDFLRLLPDGARILDIGAGPGHLTRAYFRRFPRSRCQWVLLDSSAELLQIASRRLKRWQTRLTTVHRSFSQSDLNHGLGRFAAIVSNNALYPLPRKKQIPFHRACHAMLKPGGLFLNQTPCAYSGADSPYGKDPFEHFVRQLPESILPNVSKRVRALAGKIEMEKNAALARQRQALERAKAEGVHLPKQEPWEFLSEAEHVANLRQAGYAAGCVWRKREFIVLLGVKPDARKPR